MPTLITPETDRYIPAPTQIRWTRQQCNAIRDAGILTERYELIEGVIISKMGQKRPHAYAVMKLMKWLVSVFGGDFVQVQLPIEMVGADNSTSEPEPDVTVMAKPVSAYPTSTPSAEDALLVVEVADSSLGFDRTVKAALYARSGIREYWIVDVVGRRMLVHREPHVSGYGRVVELTENETISTLARPDESIVVGELLPPEA